MKLNIKNMAKDRISYFLSKIEKYLSTIEEVSERRLKSCARLFSSTSQEWSQPFWSIISDYNIFLSNEQSSKSLRHANLPVTTQVTTTNKPRDYKLTKYSATQYSLNVNIRIQNFIQTFLNKKARVSTSR